MSAPLAGKFQDHYKVLGIEPAATDETIQTAYGKLASQYNPRNRTTGDAEKFAQVNLAYEVLSDAAARTAFDAVRGSSDKESTPVFSGQQFFDVLAAEPARRNAIMCILYDRRLMKPISPGLSLRQLEQMMQADSEQLQFSIWYLRKKSLITCDDKSNFTITVLGMDYLEKYLPTLESVTAVLKDVEETPEGKPDAAKEAAMAQPPEPESQPKKVTEPAPATVPAQPSVASSPRPVSRAGPSIASLAERMMEKDDGQESKSRRTIVIPPRSR